MKKPLYLALLLVLFLVPYGAMGQALYSARSMGTGGGGVTYLSGYSAQFLNPANLLINDYHSKLEIGVAQTGLLLNSRPADNQNPLTFLYHQFSPSGVPYDSSIPASKVLTSWFPDNSRTYSRNADYDMLLFGLSWREKDKAFSVAMRSRAINKLSMTRGWYDPVFESTTGASRLERGLQQTIAEYTEISFGYAQELNIISGWTPHLNRLYFGLAPKFILPGMFFNGDYQSDYYTTVQSGIYRQYLYSNSTTTGRLSNEVNRMNAYPSLSTFNLANNDLTSPTGWGIGLDAGFTYIINLDNDRSLLNGKPDHVIKKSLRFSLSVTDIGFISYTRNVKSFQSPPDSLTVNSIPAVTGHPFTASPGTFPLFVAADDIHGVAFNPQGTLSHHYLNASLPVALHAGSEFEWKWIMLAADVQFNLNHSTFNTSNVEMHMGTEIHLIPHVPLRAGVRFMNKQATTFAIGTGLNTRYFNIDASAMINTHGISQNTYPIAAAVAAIQLHF